MIITRADFESLVGNIPNISWPTPPRDADFFDEYYLLLDTVVCEWLHSQFNMERT